MAGLCRMVAVNKVLHRTLVLGRKNCAYKDSRVLQGKKKSKIEYVRVKMRNKHGTLDDILLQLCTDDSTIAKAPSTAP